MTLKEQSADPGSALTLAQIVLRRSSVGGNSASDGQVVFLLDQDGLRYLGKL